MKTKQICIGIAALVTSFGAFAQDAAEDLNGPTVVCVGQLAGEPRLFPIVDKIDVAPMPFAAMPRTPERTATASERKAIALWMERRDECFTAGTQYRVKTLLPEEQSYAASLYNVQRGLAVELLKGKMTYAEYNQTRFDLFKAAQYEAGYPAASAAW